MSLMKVMVGIHAPKAKPIHLSLEYFFTRQKCDSEGCAQATETHFLLEYFARRTGTLKKNGMVALVQIAKIL